LEISRKSYKGRRKRKDSGDKSYQDGSRFQDKDSGKMTVLFILAE